MTDPQATTGAGGPLVLYIEDDPVNVVLMQELFRLRPGWRLEVAWNGADGIEAARRLHPALLLVDMHLPDMSGQDVVSALRAEPCTRALHCVALSADALPEQAQEAVRGGFDDYLTKPIDVAGLLAWLDRRVLR